MRLMLISAAALSLVASAAFAQSNTPAQSAPQNAAVKSVTQNNSAAPVAGANSFTQNQAMKQIEAKGYSRVSNLTKDQKGIWRGTATKNGRSGPISVDYQGNVN